MWPCGACHHYHHQDYQYQPLARSRTKTEQLTKQLGPAIRDTANAMCKDKPSDNKTKTRAASEVPVATISMAATSHSPQINRASSIGPIMGLSNKRSFRDKGAYECNYESIDSWSSSSNEADSSSAIWKLESTVKSIDSLIEKPKHYDHSKVNNSSDKSNSKIQYDSITVLPPPPPPPLPRTRSFKHYRAHTVHPWVSAPHTVGGRASSAPPISPLHQRRVIFSDR